MARDTALSLSLVGDHGGDLHDNPAESNPTLQIDLALGSYIIRCRNNPPRARIVIQ